jgi:cell wall-associated NlpC family hydrolase
MSAFRALCAGLAATLVLVGAAPAGAATPDWVKPAVRHLADQGWLDRSEFRANKPMARAAFKTLVKRAFGGGYGRSKGKVRAAEVSRALVRLLDQQAAVDRLMGAASPGGWSPARPAYLGYEVVAREMGLRHDRPTDEERFEASARDPMTQADVVWAVWRAATSPSLSGAQALTRFGLADYDAPRRKVVEYALSLVGTPYVWAGEWPAATPKGYPYGAQSTGGFDCSGFIWYVLKAKTEGYDPIGRPYKGWALAERSSADMARATPRKERLGYRKLLGGDVVLFTPKGRDGKPGDVYHAGIYLGKGWMIHSSGSRGGVSISSIAPGSWWHDQLIFGRRVVPS